MSENNKDGIKYVTYKWLFGSIGSVLAVMITLLIFAINAFDKKIDARLDKELYKSEYSSLCLQMGRLETKVERNEEIMRRIEAMQQRVLATLKMSHRNE